MKRIELIGPSGVGKTTLYRQITETPQNSRAYMTLRDAYRHAAIHESVSLGKPILWFYQQLLKYDLFNERALGLGKRVLHGLKKWDESMMVEYYKPFFVSYTIYLEIMQRDRYNPYEMSKRLKKLTDIIEEYLILEDSLSDKYLVLYDEGMAHYHPGITKYGTKFYSPEEVKQDITLNPSGIISCEQTADVIFEQALKRKEQGIYTFTQGPMTDEELKNHIFRSVEFLQKKVALFKKNNIPVLHIDTGDPLDLNLKKINNFILTLK